LRILDREGKELPAREVGLVYFLPPGGAGSTYHYLGATGRRTEDGWETLGDLGYVDEDGYLYLTDRETDMIVSGGANVYPAEVEAAIDSFEPVRSSAVIGLPDDDLGSRVHAIVDAPGGFEERELVSHLEAQLARFKIPRSFERVDEPLRDDAGKVRRSALRAARVAGGTEAARVAGGA
jgi:bile acid-coenzyme A ligase